MKKIQIKNKKAFWITTSVAAVALIVVLYFVFRKKADTESEETPNTGTDTGNEQENIFPLKNGATGIYVVKLQQYLQSQGEALPQFGIDGVFGPETEAAVRNVFGANSVSWAQFVSKIGNV